MTLSHTTTVTGLTETTQALQRAQAAAGPAQQAEVKALGDRYQTVLKQKTPLGKGERPGRLRAGYQISETYTAQSASYGISNTVPHLRYVLEGRGPVEATRAKALRFVINGRVLFRKRVGPAAANPFDDEAKGEMQGSVRGLGERIVGRIVRAYEGK